MNLLFLTLVDFSSIDESGIYTDLMKKFVDEGHSVCIVSPTEKRKQSKTILLNKGKYKILKLQIGNTQKTNLIEKGISFLTLETKFMQGIKKYFSNIKFDLILYSTPPITFQRAIGYVKKRDSAKSYLLLKDIFPQNAVDLNMLSKMNPVYWYFRNKEKKLYANSDYIGSLSQANVDYIIRHNPKINRNIVEVCPNSIEPSVLGITEEKRRAVREKYNIPLNKIVFIYGGNLGKPQGIDFLIECIKSNVRNEKSYFLVVGSGTEFGKLSKYFDDERPKNAQLLSQLPKNDFDILVSSCDIGLIFLDKRFTIPNFPSRLLSYMQASLPVIAATDRSTDIGKVLKEGRFGFWCESNNVEDFNYKVNQLLEPELMKEMGTNAREYLKKNYTVGQSYRIIMRHFNI